MFKVIAVDPGAIVRSDRDLVYVLEKFGMHQGRVISEFPRRWKAMAFEAAQRRHRGKVELARITERLRQVHDGVLYSSGRPGGDAALAWVQRAAVEHAREPFDAILVEDDPTDPPFVQLDHFDEAHACLVPNRQWDVRREALRIAKICFLHLRTAKHVKLVDPYMDLSQRRFRRPFESMLAEAGANRPLVDIYRSDSLGESETIRRADWLASKAASAGFSVRLFIRPEASMHNRFVLSDRGGLMFATGLDDDDDGGGTSHDVVTLLDPPLWRNKWLEYSDDRAAFEWRPE